MERWGKSCADLLASVLAHKTQVIVHQGSDGENVRGIYSGADDLDSDRVIFLDDHVILWGLVAWRVGVGVKAHVSWDGVAGNEAGERPDLSEQSHLVNLGHHGIQDLSFEWPK